MSIENISSVGLRRAARIKDKIEALQQDLARILGSSTSVGAADAPRKRRKMSAAAKAKIAAAARKRWAKYRAEKNQG